MNNSAMDLKELERRLQPLSETVGSWPDSMNPAADKKSSNPSKRRKSSEAAKSKQPKEAKQPKKIKLETITDEENPKNNAKSNSNWEALFNNSSISGIEFRNSETSEPVRFIAIKHPEILESQQVFRIAVKVGNNGTFEMPKRQTFEEMIQAKRRFQQLLYGSNTSANSSILSERAARRVAAAARRQNLPSNRRRTTTVPPVIPVVTEPTSQQGASEELGPETSNPTENGAPRAAPPPRSRVRGSRRASSSRRSGSSRRRPASGSRRPAPKRVRPSRRKTPQVGDSTATPSKPRRPSARPKAAAAVAAATAALTLAGTDLEAGATPAIGTNVPTTSTPTASPLSQPAQIAGSPPKTPSINRSLDLDLPSTSGGLTPSTQSNPPSTIDPSETPICVKSADGALPASVGKVVTSLKELKNNPMLGEAEAKHIKMHLKSLPPGSAIVLSNGTVIKKSRRGGARVGAGRKRSRPLPNCWYSDSQHPSSATTPTQSHQGSPNKSELSYDGSASNQSSIRPSTSLALD